MQHRLVKLLGRPAPWLLGVVNVTPDSFSDGGLYLATDAALAHGRQLVAEGAHMLDLGGKSTAPGSRPITSDEELLRLEPVVRGLAREAILSIDTYHAATAARCIQLGARIVNDVSGLRADPEMAAVVRDLGPVLVMMHAKDGPLPHATDRPVHYGDVVREVGDWLAAGSILRSRPESTPTSWCSTPAGASSSASTRRIAGSCWRASRNW